MDLWNGSESSRKKLNYRTQASIFSKSIGQTLKPGGGLGRGTLKKSDFLVKKREYLNAKVDILATVRRAQIYAGSLSSKHGIAWIHELTAILEYSGLLFTFHHFS